MFLLYTNRKCVALPFSSDYSGFARLEEEEYVLNGMGNKPAVLEGLRKKCLCLILES